MAYATHCNSIIRAEFFKPLFEFCAAAKHRRNCSALDDALWLEAGVRRCLGIFQSGRHFLQQLADRHDTRILATTFFESLKSERRLGLLGEILGQVRSRMRRDMPDPFARHQCLDDFEFSTPGTGRASTSANGSRGKSNPASISSAARRYSTSSRTSSAKPRPGPAAPPPKPNKPGFFALPTTS